MDQSTLTRLFQKTSHRTLAEQCVGFGIIASASFLFAFLLMTFFTEGALWLATLINPFWTLSNTYAYFVLVLVHASLTFSFWILWRSFSLRKLKLELSLFLSAFILESIWGLSLFKGHETLLALFALLLWMSAQVILTALFWKKEKAAGILLFLPLLWTFYLISTNMALCIANP